MLLLLKLVCFCLWLVMMGRLIWPGKSESQAPSPVRLHLEDRERAEYQIRRILRQMAPADCLFIEISDLNSDWPELLFIASRLQQVNPSIIIHAGDMPTAAQPYQP